MSKNIEMNIKQSTGTYEVLYPATIGSQVSGTVSSATTASSCTGNANTATTLATGRTIRVNLASTSTATFNGGSNVTPGVNGTLSVNNGGTGTTSLSSLANSLSSYFILFKSEVGYIQPTLSSTQQTFTVPNITNLSMVILIANDIYANNTATYPYGVGIITQKSGALFLDHTKPSINTVGLLKTAMMCILSYNYAGLEGNVFWIGDSFVASDNTKVDCLQPFNSANISTVRYLAFGT